MDGREPDGLFRCSGEGQLGDMKFTSGDRAIRDAAKGGKDLHPFQWLGKGHLRYVGRLSCSFREPGGARVISRAGVAT